MLRTALAVAVATALLGISLPVIDSARVTHAETSVETALGRLDTAASELAATSDPLPASADGARRQHVLRLPRGSWGSASLAELRFPPPDSQQKPTWRVTGGQWARMTTSVSLVGPPDGLTLTEGGRQRVELTLQRRDGDVVVVIARPDV